MGAGNHQGAMNHQMRSQRSMSIQQSPFHSMSYDDGFGGQDSQNIDMDSSLGLGADVNQQNSDGFRGNADGFEQSQQNFGAGQTNGGNNFGNFQDDGINGLMIHGKTGICQGDHFCACISGEFDPQTGTCGTQTPDN